MCDRRFRDCMAAAWFTYFTNNIAPSVYICIDYLHVICAVYIHNVGIYQMNGADGVCAIVVHQQRSIRCERSMLSLYSLKLFPSLMYTDEYMVR